MKTRNSLLLAFAFCGVLTSNHTFAQDKKEEAAKTVAPVAKEEVWQERSDFHKVMSSTFHPMEDGDFKPIRERAGELHAKAEAWAKSTAPKSMDKPEIKEKLNLLVSQASELKNKIADKATDDEIKVKLTAMHDTFHQIAGLCKPGM